MAKKAVLFLNGSINLSFSENYIEKYYKNYPIYCADGAYNLVSRSNKLFFKVQRIIGDIDSIKSYNQHGHLYLLNTNPHFTDFEKALFYLTNLAIETIIIFGFGGKEMDHYLGNVSVLLAYKDRVKIKIIDEYGSSCFMKPAMRVRSVRNRIISIVPLFQLLDITVSGFVFNFQHHSLIFGQKIGIRNRAFLDTVLINYRSGCGLLFIAHNS